MAKTYKDIIAWQKAHQLVLKVYKITQKFPKEEKYGLTSDMRRAVRSVPTNIVEGFGRNGYKDALHFYNISEASLEELKYQTLLSLDLIYINKDEYVELKKHEEEVGRLLNGWQQSYLPKKEKALNT